MTEKKGDREGKVGDEKATKKKVRRGVLTREMRKAMEGKRNAAM